MRKCIFFMLPSLLLVGSCSTEAPHSKQLRIARYNGAGVDNIGVAKPLAINYLANVSLTVSAEINSQSTEDEAKVYLVFLSEGTNQEVIEKYGEIDYRFKIFNAVVARLTGEGAERLRQEPGVKRVEEDQIVELGANSNILKKVMQNDEITILSGQNQTDIAAEQWNLTEQGINAIAAWSNFNVDGNGVKIAIIDSGVNYTLPDLSAGYLGGWDFCPIGGGRTCYDNCYPLKDPLLCEDDDPMDQYGHGTEMATAILSRGNTIIGIAPQTQYYAIKITNDDQRSFVSILMKGVEWAITNTDADIIYIGIKKWSNTWWMSNAFDSNYAQGMLFVTPTWSNELAPAAYAGTIDVGAHNREPQDLNSENGNLVEVVAPGEEVPVLNLNGEVSTAADSIGVAAAQVAGALALMIDYNQTQEKGYNNAALRQAQNLSTIDLWHGDPNAGYGKADVNGALTWLANDWFLEYKVNYLNPITFDESGVPVYLKRDPIQYNITITNNSNQTSNPKEINDVNVVSRQTIPNTPEFFTVITLQPGETKTVGPYTFHIPAETPTDYYNTQITLKKEILMPLRYLPFLFIDKAIIKKDNTASTFQIIDIVNFGDFAVFASWWLLPCDEGNLWCDGMDLVRNGVIDFEDLKEFVSYWLCQYP